MRDPWMTTNLLGDPEGERLLGRQVENGRILLK